MKRKKHALRSIIRTELATDRVTILRVKRAKERSNLVITIYNYSPVAIHIQFDVREIVWLKVSRKSRTIKLGWRFDFQKVGRIISATSIVSRF